MTTDKLATGKECLYKEMPVCAWGRGGSNRAVTLCVKQAGTVSEQAPDVQPNPGTEQSTRQVFCYLKITTTTKRQDRIIGGVSLAWGP